MPRIPLSPPRPKAGRPDPAKLDRIVAAARKEADVRAAGYRERSLRIHGPVCARCAREFDASNLHLLTVHHRDGNHDNNPADGSNWENLCVWCHENEHARVVDHQAAAGGPSLAKAPAAATHSPFAGLADLLKPRR